MDKHHTDEHLHYRQYIIFFSVSNTNYFVPLLRKKTFFNYSDTDQNVFIETAYNDSKI